MEFYLERKENKYAFLVFKKGSNNLWQRKLKLIIFHWFRKVGKKDDSRYYMGKRQERYYNS